MSPMYNVDPSLGFSVLIAVGCQLTYSAKGKFGTPESDTDSECKTSINCWSSYPAKWLNGVRRLIGQDLEVNKRNEAKSWSRQSLRMDLMKLVKQIVSARISPYRHLLSMLSDDVSTRTDRIGLPLRNSALPWLICSTAETKNKDDCLPTFPYHHTATKRHPWKFVPRSGVLKKDAATMNVIHRSPDQGEKMGKHVEQQDSTIQGLDPRKTVEMENEESGKMTFIKRSKGQRVGTRYLTDGYGIVALWRPQVEIVLISGPSSRQDQISEGPPESKSCQEKDQHTDERRGADPEDCHGGEDHEDHDYFARMAEAYRKNFCEEIADLFVGTMAAGRWDDIVTQLNFPKSKADQLLSDSVSALKQKASEAYDSHPHHTSPPETLFRLQEDLVREAVLALAKQCREQNARSPQVFGKK